MDDMRRLAGRWVGTRDANVRLSDTKTINNTFIQVSNKWEIKNIRYLNHTSKENFENESVTNPL